jgi:hypothetical protein
MARYRIETTGKNYSSDGPIAVQDGWVYFNVNLTNGGLWAVGVPIGQIVGVVDTKPQSPVLEPVPVEEVETEQDAIEGEA